MGKWTIGGRQYFAAPVDTPEIRAWLADLPSRPVYEVLPELFYDGMRAVHADGIEVRVASWKLSRVIDEIERRIKEGREP